MTRIVFSILISTAAGFFIGKHFYKSYKDRRLYYCGLVEFIGAIMNNLSFKQEKLIDIVRDFSNKTNAVFAQQLKNFSEYISGMGEFSITCDSMKKESAPIEAFFKNVGTVDIFTQKEVLKNYFADFSEKAKTSTEEEKTKGMMYLKIFTLAGLAVGILLM